MSKGTWVEGDAEVPPVDAAVPPVAGARYEVLSLLGEGGMGRVSEAWDRQFQRVVALKEVRPGADAGLVRRFLQEATITGQLDHPAIPAVYERGVREDGTPFYAMRRVQGRTLAERLADAKGLSDRLELLPALVHVAQAVGHAHERGVVHRDLKPDNIVVGTAGQASVLDWGLAKIRGVIPGEPSGPSMDDGPIGYTRVGAVLGTLGYMAPEQAQGRPSDVDERTDVFALGALLYHLLAGVPPYAGGSASELREQAASTAWTPLAKAAPGAPVGLRAIAERAMAADPAKRYATGAKFAEALGAVMVDAVSRPDTGARRLAGLAVGSIAAIALIAVGASLWVLPQLTQMGFLSLLSFDCTAASIALCGVEWRTQGRLGLDPLLLALAAITALYGIGGAALGTTMTVRAAGDLLADHPPTEVLALVFSGLNESLGGAALGAVLASVQLIGWSVLRSAAIRRARPEARG